MYSNLEKRTHRKQAEENMCKLKDQMCWNSKGVFIRYCNICTKIQVWSLQRA